MKDLHQLAAECVADLLSIGICPGKVTKWTVNTRAKHRWGLCRQTAPGEYQIEVADRLLQDNVSDQAAKDTILHELLHTVKGCHGHKGEWKNLAAKVNRLLPQYNIKRTASSEEKGLDAYPVKRNYRYIIQCVKCGKEYHRDRMCRVVESPQYYYCGACHGKLKRIK